MGGFRVKMSDHTVAETLDFLRIPTKPHVLGVLLGSTVVLLKNQNKAVRNVESLETIFWAPRNPKKFHEKLPIRVNVMRFGVM